MEENQKPTDEEIKAAQILADCNIHHQTPEQIAEAQRVLSAQPAEEKK